MPAPIPSDLREAAKISKAWPYEEARKLLKRYPDGPAEGGIVFETGYGPSGLPHLGTFQEVARTLMVRHALSELVDWPSRLIAFSDDMDGMRKVPPGVPHQDMMHAHLDQPLSKVPDPFGCGHASYADHNNGILRQFLDRFGFDYEFLASSDCYASGRFDEALKAVLRNYDAIMDVMLPTLGEERRKTYSPVLPISAAGGKVLQVPITVLDAEAGLVAFEDDGRRIEQSILSGGAKLQWKVDWAMRWVALGVDYEMSGKDLIDSVTQSSKIARILGARPPEGFNYEMFLDENGEKISKTKGNGVTIDEWLAYAPEESLAFYIYRDPKRAKQLSLSVIPKAVDEYYQFLAAYPDQAWDKRLGNPVHHVHAGQVPNLRLPISFALLLNVASLPGVGDRETIWSFLRRYNSNLTPEASPELDRLVGYAVEYGCRFVAPALRRRPPTPEEALALRELDRNLEHDDGTGRPDEDPAVILQNHVYEIGKKYYGKEGLRDWFKALYETLLGSEQGPRMGSFIALYGVDNSRKLIAEALELVHPEEGAPLKSSPLYPSYKPLRNFLRGFGQIPALSTIHQLMQYLQFDRPLPPGLVPPAILEKSKFGKGLFEWELEILSREIILNSSNSGERRLDQWSELATALNHVKRIENDASGMRKVTTSILWEIARIPHRQFHWQRRFDEDNIVRSYRLFSHPAMAAIIAREFSMDTIEFYQVGLALSGCFINSMHLRTPVTNSLNSVSPEVVNSFIDRYSRPIEVVREELTVLQQYDVNWAYTFNPIWLHPLLRISENDVIAPIPTLLLYRITSWIYFDLVGTDGFSNAFGKSFQDYVGDVAQAANETGNLRILPEEKYGPKKARKDSADWIVEDLTGSILIECKSSRMKFQAKTDISNLDPLREEIEKLSSFVAQLYITMEHALRGDYHHWKPPGTPLYPVVVTLEDWHAFGPEIDEMLHASILGALSDKGVSGDLVNRHPYQIWSVDDFEMIAQVLSQKGISPFLEPKIQGEKRYWPVHNYLVEYIREHGVDLRPLFPDDMETISTRRARSENRLGS